MTALLLVPSPLLGPATWAPVAQVLGAEVVPTAGVRSGADLVDAVVTVASGRPVVLVPHSNAGLAVPAIGERADVEATVYVDAALPTTSPTALARPAFLDHLRGLADADGVLPPWTRWWSEEQLDGVFPTAEARVAVEAEEPRLPLAYFTGTLPVPDGWAARASAYLAFGETYADEVALATAHGWPVRSVAGRHLHQLHDPVGVAAAVTDLLDACRAPRPPAAARPGDAGPGPDR